MNELEDGVKGNGQGLREGKGKDKMERKGGRGRGKELDKVKGPPG